MYVIAEDAEAASEGALEMIKKSGPEYNDATVLQASEYDPNPQSAANGPAMHAFV